MTGLKGSKFSRKHFHRSHKLQLIRGGQAYFDLLDKLIENASDEIHIQIYIVEDDSTGRRLIESLIRAAKRGVNVFMVLDAYGSSNLTSNTLQKIHEAGIQFKWFRPVIGWKNMEFGRRMHHKIIAIDETIAVVSGINIADRYNDVDAIPAWLDFGLIVEGVTVREIKRRCLQVWERSYRLMKKWRRFRLPAIHDSISVENPLVKVSVNDWLRGKRDIYKGYRRAFRYAETELIIVGGYFLPGNIMRRSLREAAARGVQISVILTRVSDVRFAKPAEQYLYNWMFRNNIRIYEWTPAMMHGKVAVADRYWSTVGSYNLNYLSNFESLELNLEIADNVFSASLSDLLQDIIKQECVEVTAEDFHRKRSALHRMNHWMSYHVVRYSMRILNVFTNRPKPT